MRRDKTVARILLVLSVVHVAVAAPAVARRSSLDVAGSSTPALEKRIKSDDEGMLDSFPLRHPGSVVSMNPEPYSDSESVTSSDPEQGSGPSSRYLEEPTDFESDRYYLAPDWTGDESQYLTKSGPGSSSAQYDPAPMSATPPTQGESAPVSAAPSTHDDSVPKSATPLTHHDPPLVFGTSPTHGDSQPASITPPTHDGSSPVSPTPPTHHGPPSVSGNSPSHDDLPPASITSPTHDDPSSVSGHSPSHDKSSPASITPPTHDDSSSVSPTPPPHNDPPSVSGTSPTHEDSVPDSPTHDDPLSVSGNSPTHDNSVPASITPSTHDGLPPESGASQWQHTNSWSTWTPTTGPASPSHEGSVQSAHNDLLPESGAPPWKHPNYPWMPWPPNTEIVPASPSHEGSVQSVHNDLPSESGAPPLHDDSTPKAYVPGLSPVDSSNSGHDELAPDTPPDPGAPSSPSESVGSAATVKAEDIGKTDASKLTDAEKFWSEEMIQKTKDYAVLGTVAGVSTGLINGMQKEIMGTVSPGAYVSPLSLFCRHPTESQILTYDLPQSNDWQQGSCK